MLNRQVCHLASDSSPRSAMVACRLNRLRPSSGRHFCQTLTFFRVVAEPEQGTSATIASYPGAGIRPI